MLAQQKSGKGTSVILDQEFVLNIAAKLDDVTKILADLKTDLDSPKLSSHRTSDYSFPLWTVLMQLQSESSSSSSSRSMVGTLQMPIPSSHKTYDSSSQQCQGER